MHCSSRRALTPWWGLIAPAPVSWFNLYDDAVGHDFEEGPRFFSVPFPGKSWVLDPERETRFAVCVLAVSNMLRLAGGQTVRNSAARLRRSHLE